MRKTSWAMALLAATLLAGCGDRDEAQEQAVPPGAIPAAPDVRPGAGPAASATTAGAADSARTDSLSAGTTAADSAATAGR